MKMLTLKTSLPTSWHNFVKMILPVVMLSIALPVAAAEIVTDVDATKVSKSRATPLGLYLSPKAAHLALVQNPDILLVDVRDPVEVSFIGHPEGMDQNIPSLLATLELDPKRGLYKMIRNPNFVAEMDALLKREGLTKADPLFVTCRSGPRSGAAARLLIKAGYTNVWNLVEGFEGSTNANGVRAKNGWRNAGMPWEYKLTAKTAWRPLGQ
jgi:rhodanese-related sulfurtransferase